MPAPVSQAARAASQVRPVAMADAEPAAQTLARAFHDDPVMMHFLPDDATRTEKLARVFRILLKLGVPYKSCFVTGAYEAVTLWRPPNRWHVPFTAYLTNAPELLSIFGLGVFRVMSTMDMMEKIHPEEPHWYLQTIGTEPRLQGRGFGSVIMRDRLAEVDAKRLPCYLESSKETNIPIYRSFGFEVTGEIAVPGGPKIWPMWRAAQ